MDKDIRQYLHYYLGGESIYDNNKWKMSQIGHRYVRLVREGEFHRFVDVFLDSAKPILRKLESMTEEEALDLANMDTRPERHKDIQILWIKKDSIHFIDGTKWYGDGVSEYNEFFIWFNELNAEKFHYLLSKGFDLFGLIESGLALDKDKL